MKSSRNSLSNLRDAKCMLSISIYGEDREDIMSWKFTSMNEYSVKLGFFISWKISLLIRSIKWMEIGESCEQWHVLGIN
jgi:hypothetical protein